MQFLSWLIDAEHYLPYVYATHHVYGKPSGRKSVNIIMLLVRTCCFCLTEQNRNHGTKLKHKASLYRSPASILPRSKRMLGCELIWKNFGWWPALQYNIFEFLVLHRLYYSSAINAHAWWLGLCHLCVILILKSYFNFGPRVPQRQSYTPSVSG